MTLLKIIILIAFLFQSAVYGQSIDGNDWKLFQLRGKVKSVYEESIDCHPNTSAHRTSTDSCRKNIVKILFDDHGSCTLLLSIDKINVFYDSTVVSHDANHRKIHEYSYENNKRGAIVDRFTFYQYDDAGHLIESMMIDSPDHRKILTRYNQRGEKKEEQQQYNDGFQPQKKSQFKRGNYRKTYTYEYDHKGRIIKTLIYTSDTLTGWETFKYDKDSNVILQEYYDTKGKEQTQESKYDRHHNLIMVIYSKGDGTIQMKMGYKYDQHNNRIELDSYDYKHPNTISEISKTQYEYDSIGNYTKYTDLKPNGETSTVTRTIIYY